MGRRADFSRILTFEKSWSKQKQAFEPQGAMMDTHTLPLIACAWRLLCEMPSSQGSRNGVGTPPRDRPLGRRRFFRRFCVHFLRDSETPIFLSTKTPKKNLRKICAKICGNICALIEHQKSAQKSAHRICAKNLRKNLRINLRTTISAKIVSKTGVKILSLWKMKARKKHRKNLRKLCAKPQSLGLLHGKSADAKDPNKPERVSK